MESAPGSEFTVAELKEALRERGLAANGTKVELIKRLSASNPGVWEELGARQRGATSAPDSLGPAGVCQPTEDGGIVGAATSGETRMQGERLSIAAFGAEERDDVMRMELALLRRAGRRNSNYCDESWRYCGAPRDGKRGDGWQRCGSVGRRQC